MSVEEKAKDATAKLDGIIKKASSMQQPVAVLLFKYDLGTESIELSTAQKQKLLTKYQSLKAELKALVDALP
jgi:hypothetical protein